MLVSHPVFGNTHLSLSTPYQPYCLSWSDLPYLLLIDEEDNEIKIRIIRVQ